ncbi:MAG: DUF3450 domain-containing protein [Amphiplicatus sp.]
MMKRVSLLGSVAAALVALSAPASAQFSTALQESEATAKEGKASQQRVDQLDDQTASLLNDYRANLKQLEAARRYNASLERQIEGQNRDIAQLRTDIENVSGLQRAMQPLMEDMLNGLEQFIEADMPFDIVERTNRVNRLRGVMSDSGASAAQRYRLIVEAYQIENEFGRTIGAYQGSIDVDGQTLTGDFLRIGRLSLMFKTPDDSVLKIFDRSQGGWVDLDRSNLASMRLGLRMAREQTAPDLLPVPVKPAQPAAEQQ